MLGRRRNPLEEASNTLGHMLDDVKTGATTGAIKGAVRGAVGTLHAQATDAAHSAAKAGDDLAPRARKARKNAGKALARTADTAGETADRARGAAQSAAKDANLDDKLGTLTDLLRTVGRRGDNVTGRGLTVNIDADDVPRLIRGTILIATGLGTLFAPGSPFDIGRSVGADSGDFTAHLADHLGQQTRQRLDAATYVTQQRIKDLIDLAKDALSTFSNTLVTGVESSESRMQKVLDETETRLTQVVGQTSDRAKQPLAQQDKGAGTLRWLVWGLLFGGLAGFLSSPARDLVGNGALKAQWTQDPGQRNGAEDVKL